MSFSFRTYIPHLSGRALCPLLDAHYSLTDSRLAPIRADPNSFTFGSALFTFPHILPYHFSTSLPHHPDVISSPSRTSKPNRPPLAVPRQGRLELPMICLSTNLDTRLLTFWTSDAQRTTPASPRPDRPVRTYALSFFQVCDTSRYSSRLAPSGQA